MKNRYQENLKKSAKLYHRNERNSNFIKGLIQYYQYDEVSSTSLSWWCDVDFILNDYRVVVAWTHPRQHYKDYIHFEAHKSVAHLGASIDGIFNKSTPSYVKVGQSRKKIVSYTMHTFPKLSDEIDTAHKLALQKIQHSNDYHAKPYIKTAWLAHGYFVEICVPIEVRGVDDLVKLVTLVKRLLKRETTLESEFPDYVYTKKEWLAETLKTKIK